MSRALSHLITGITTLAIVFLILFQKDADGGLLVNGWHGLGLACLLLIIVSITNLIGALHYGSEPSIYEEPLGMEYCSDYDPNHVNTIRDLQRQVRKDDDAKINHHQV